jgi:hypothetical protein
MKEEGGSDEKLYKNEPKYGLATERSLYRRKYLCQSTHDRGTNEDSLMSL